MDFYNTALQIKNKTNALSHPFQSKPEKQGKKITSVSVISPKHFKADGHLESVEGVISLLYTAARAAEKTMLFSFSYLIHKTCLMVLILCVKKWKFHAAASQLHIWLLFCSCKATLKNYKIWCDKSGIHTRNHIVPSLWCVEFLPPFKVPVSRTMASVTCFYKQNFTNVFNTTEICKWPHSMTNFKYEIHCPIYGVFFPFLPSSYFGNLIKNPTQKTISQHNISVKHLKWDFDLLAP